MDEPTTMELLDAANKARHIGEDALADALIDQLERRIPKSAEPAFLPSEPPAPMFRVEGCDDRRFTLAEMRAANVDDAHVLSWLEAAKVGDVLDTFHGNQAMRVA